MLALLPLGIPSGSQPVEQRLNAPAAVGALVMDQAQPREQQRDVGARGLDRAGSDLERWDLELIEDVVSSAETRLMR